MSTRARRNWGALSLLALLALVVAAVATAADAPPHQGSETKGTPNSGKVHKVGQSTPTATAPKAVHADAYRLAAPLSGTGTTATGLWVGYLIHTNGVVQSGTTRSAAGCQVRSMAHPPARPGVRRTGIAMFACQPLPPFAVPASGNHWILVWQLTYKTLSGAPTGTDVRLNSPGSAGALVATVCTTCTSGKFGRVEITADQANALLAGNGYVVVRTAAKPDGEITGQIMRVTLAQLQQLRKK